MTTLPSIPSTATAATHVTNASAGPSTSAFPSMALPPTAVPAPVVPARAARGRFWEGVYRLADPKITLASVAAMALGGAVAAAHGPLSWPWLAVTVLGIFCIEAAKNASGEIFDWDSGTDRAVTPEERTPFSGGKRVIVDGLLTRSQTAAVAVVFYGLGAVAGVAIALLREPSVLWLGLVGAALAFFYHAPPVKLAYRGLGELAVAISYGPVIACGTYLVQRGRLDPEVALASVPLGVAIMAFLFVNEIPDRRADELARKRTLVVRLGLHRAALAFSALWGVFALAILALPWLGLPLSTWLGLGALPLGLAAAREVRRYAASEPGAALDGIVAAQGITLLAFLITALGLGAGVVIGLG